MSDVRETPTSGLRDYLLSKGAEVAWHDPLVTVWEGTHAVDLEWPCDVAVLAMNQPGMHLNQLISRGVLILDCTNSLEGISGVSSL